ncbi:hypothetical protein ACEWY4_025650 [Coilia grayii]|uniref:Carbonic anhydrase n=1 Tax=Coilia grayii TaxID=363190 RepID=A0ABD1IUP9_9TELE
MKGLINSGHTVKCELEAGEVEVRGGGLGHHYSAVQFHLHWGREDLMHFPGSEHSVDGHRYPIEMHIVSVKEGLTTAEAVKDSGGLAVLGFFIDVKEGNETGLPKAWESFTKLLEKIPENGDQVDMSLNISIEDLLMNVDLTKYYRYNGSLTTPTCDEAVVWTVFPQPIRISKDLILRFAQKAGFTDTYRPQQTLNDRHVYASANLDATTPSSGHEWCYDGCGHGPANWSHISGAYCGGKIQSPIDISSHHAMYKPLGNFSFFGFSNKSTMDYLINNGHTVQAVLKSGAVEVAGGGLDHIYSTLQFHFHWGNSSNHGPSTGHRSESSHPDTSTSQESTSSNGASEDNGKTGGSEHLLDSRVYPMEMHIVSMRKDETTSQALQNPTGFAVLGFFIEATDDTDKPASWKNFTDHLIMIEKKDSTTDLHQDISLDTLIGNVDLSKFYRYQGSLTTPSCNEAVVWTIFKEPIRVSKNLIKKFSDITGMNNIFRPVQPLNGREVFTTATVNSPENGQASSSPSCHISLLLILLCLYATLWINQQ